MLMLLHFLFYSSMVGRQKRLVKGSCVMFSLGFFLWCAPQEEVSLPEFGLAMLSSSIEGMCGRVWSSSINATFLLSLIIWVSILSMVLSILHSFWLVFRKNDQSRPLGLFMLLLCGDKASTRERLRLYWDVLEVAMSNSWGRRSRCLICLYVCLVLLETSLGELYF